MCKMNDTEESLNGNTKTDKRIDNGTGKMRNIKYID